MVKIKRLYFDIEVSPNIVTSWNVGYKQKIDYQDIIEERKVICICWNWEGEKTIHSLSWDENRDDKTMLIEFIKVINTADELIAHNGDNFDIKWLRTRCLKYGITMFPTYVSLDTLTKARRNFRLNSNRLDYIAKYVGVGRKTQTESGLWTKVAINNDRNALKRMIKYCMNDVKILKEVYKRMTPYIQNKVHHGVLNGRTKCSCPECGSKKVTLSKKRTTTTGIERYQMICSNCTKYFTISRLTYEEFKK